MLKESINGQIAFAMKLNDKIKVEALRAIKTAFMNWETAKDNVGKSMDEAIEFNIIRKLFSQYEDAAKQCDDGKHGSQRVQIANRQHKADVSSKVESSLIMSQVIREYVDKCKSLYTTRRGLNEKTNSTASILLGLTPIFPAAATNTSSDT